MQAERFEARSAQECVAMSKQIAQHARDASMEIPFMTGPTVWKIVNEHALFLVFREMRVVGALVMLKLPTLGEAIDCRLEWPIVLSNDPDVGTISQLLIKRAIDEAARWGARMIDVTCNSGEVELARLYRELSFSRLNAVDLRYTFGA